MNKILLPTLFALCAANSATAQWTAVANGATETLVSVSSPSKDFEIAVGNNGQIVHFNGSPMGAIVASGTTKNLFEVHAVDANFAVASGQDVRLIWDGMTWSPIFPENTETARFFSPIWAPPEKNLILIQELATGLGFNTLCSYDPADLGATPLCRALQSPILQLCGISNDIKALMTNGSVIRFTDGLLSNGDDPLDMPVFAQPGAMPLNLIAAFIPISACAILDFGSQVGTAYSCE